MDKETFIEISTGLTKDISRLQDNLRQTWLEYIETNQPHEIGSKVKVILAAYKHPFNEGQVVPERVEFAYVAGYEISGNKVVPLLNQCKKDGTASTRRLYSSGVIKSIS